ncbi:MAG: sigma-70 family RNA polymerase sigma factor [Chloroflexota bacterium]
MLNVRNPFVARQQNGTDSKPENQPKRANQQAAADFLYSLQNGDERAWQQLITEWSPRLFRYVRRQLPSDEDAEDVVSETFSALIKAIKSFDGNAAISTFVYSIANRKVADFWRKRKDADELKEHVATSGPTSQPLELEEALSTLSENAQKALLLRYQMGLSVSEVADVLGRSYKATESLLSRSRSQLQTALNGDDQDV